MKLLGRRRRFFFLGGGGSQVPAQQWLGLKKEGGMGALLTEGAIARLILIKILPTAIHYEKLNFLIYVYIYLCICISVK